MDSPSKFSDWAWLPKNLLDTILDNLVPMADRIRFSAVCKHWQSVAFENFQHVRKSHKHDRPHQQQLPFLLVPTVDNSTDRRCLYDATRKSLCDFQLKVPYNIRSGGSSHGWLIFVDDYFEVTLFNPFSGKSIHFPPLKRLLFEKRIRDEYDEMSALPEFQMYEYEKRMREECDEEEIGEFVPDIPNQYEELLQFEDENNEAAEQEDEEEGGGGIGLKFEEDEAFDAPRFHKSDYSIVRGVLSADPDLSANGDFVLMVVYGLKKRLAFIKPGDKNWTYIDKDACDFFQTVFAQALEINPEIGLGFVTDVICNNGIFYALKVASVLLCIEVSDNLNIKCMPLFDKDNHHWSVSQKPYLVQSPNGDILRVIKIAEDEDGDYGNGTAVRFMVYRLMDSLENPKWIEVDSLGDVALFLGDNHSTSVTASAFIGCQPNSIYFCDDHFELYTLHGGPTDIGVYHLHDGSITRHYSLKHSQRLMPPPIWVLPKFVFTNI